MRKLFIFCLVMVCMNVHAMEIEVIDAQGNTRMHRAAILNDIDRIKALATAGVNINAINYNGQTPLHLAVYRGHVNAVKELVDRGAHKGAVDNNGDTPLRYATRNDCRDDIEALVTMISVHKKTIDDGGHVLVHRIKDVAVKNIGIAGPADKYAFDVRGKPKIKTE